MHLFYASDIDSDLYVFGREESRHCKVLRLKTADIIYLTDGKGTLYHAEITDMDQNAYKASIIKIVPHYNQRSHSLHIAISPTKSPERFEWFLEKACEIGIEEITPLICERSEKCSIKPDRLEKILIAAMKQSFSAYLPKLHPLISFKDFIKQNHDSAKYIAYCNDDERTLLTELYRAKQDAIVLIGPEGDFTTGEVDTAKKSGYIPISLGNKRLRTETAGIMACSIINIVNQ